MTYELFIARRYLRSKQKTGFLSFITFIAIGGVILGVAALVIMLSVTNGFSGEVKRRLIGMDAHVKVMKYHGESIDDYREVTAALEADAQVVAAAPVVEGTMVLGTEREEGDGVRIWGIEPESFGAVSDLPEHLYYDDDGQFHFEAAEGGKHPGIVLGRNLAHRLSVGVGDKVFLMTFANIDLEDVALMSRFRAKLHAFVVTDLFESGMYHYDDNCGFISLATAQEILRLGDAVTFIHLRVADLDRARAVRAQLAEELGYPYRVTDWTDLFPELFHWMELEKWVIFIALSLIILVASFNIMSILSMSILIKTPEIGILRAMGSKTGGIRRIFVYQGLFIGAFGTALGCIIGLVVCWLQDRFDLISIPSDIYIISNLPVDMQPLDFVLVSVVSMTISLLASVYPARKAAALQPVEAIRYIV